MSESILIAKEPTQSGNRYKLDVDILVELVWLDLQGEVPRSAVRATVSQILSMYENAKVKQYLPIIVQRQARQLLGK